MRLINSTASGATETMSSTATSTPSARPASPDDPRLARHAGPPDPSRPARIAGPGTRRQGPVRCGPTTPGTPEQRGGTRSWSAPRTEPPRPGGEAHSAPSGPSGPARPGHRDSATGGCWLGPRARDDDSQLWPSTWSLTPFYDGARALRIARRRPRGAVRSGAGRGPVDEGGRPDRQRRTRRHMT